MKMIQGQAQVDRVFLGGTCNNSTWRDQLIPLLTVDYFNPVVDDWTPECQEEEIRQRQICTKVVYVITPKMTGVYSIAEAVDDSNKRPDRVVFCCAMKDEESEFTAAQWKSICQVARMIAANGGTVCQSLEDVAGVVNAL